MKGRASSPKTKKPLEERLGDTVCHQWPHVPLTGLDLAPCGSRLPGGHRASSLTPLFMITLDIIVYLWGRSSRILGVRACFFAGDWPILLCTQGCSLGARRPLFRPSDPPGGTGGTGLRGWSVQQRRPGAVEVVDRLSQSLEPGAGGQRAGFEGLRGALQGPVLE